MNNQISQTEIETEKKPKKRNKWTSELIISKSKELFYEKGFDLSMHDIAKELNTRASSIYRHIESKRELWFAITIDDFKEFGKRMEQMATNHRGTGVELLEKMGIFFIDFAKKDFNRFQLMFLYEPPTTNNPGPYEQSCNPDSITGLVNLCQQIILEEQLKNVTPEDLAIQMFSLILGYSIIVSPINDYLLHQERFKEIKNDNYKKGLVKSAIGSALVYYK
ncbi:MAG: TetR/AcrR family transcriptional regulator [Candidatus Hodarchaeales archaeon]|jgi:AcrR family transcriptional regulator